MRNSTIKYLEEELLNLGNDYVKSLRALEDINIRSKPVLVTLKCIERQENIINNLMLIGKESNEVTQQIIRCMYIDCLSFDSTCNRLSISPKRLKLQHKTIVLDMLALLGMDNRKDSFSSFKNNSRYINKKTKEQVYKRDGGCCTKCGSTSNLQYHHVIRFSKGGLNTSDNLKLLCQRCHTKEHENEAVYTLMKSRLLEV